MLIRGVIFLEFATFIRDNWFFVNGLCSREWKSIEMLLVIDIYEVFLQISEIVQVNYFDVW